jgi:hypothetical protein
MKANRRSVAAAVVVGLSLAACARGSGPNNTIEAPPAKVERAASAALSGPRTVTLTEAASRRIDVQVGTVTASSTGQGTQIPYAAVLYDPKGDTWAFVNTTPLRFVREPIALAHIEGDVAFLTSGPPPGTKVVIVGATELYGAELGVGHNE